MWISHFEKYPCKKIHFFFLNLNDSFMWCFGCNSHAQRQDYLFSGQICDSVAIKCLDDIRAIFKLPKGEMDPKVYPHAKSPIERIYWQTCLQ